METSEKRKEGTSGIEFRRRHQIQKKYEEMECLRRWKSKKEANACDFHDLKMEKPMLLVGKCCYNNSICFSNNDVSIPFSTSERRYLFSFAGVPRPDRQYSGVS
ncbi:hypothetical protein FNV43_RR02018 [Rhamnella rubrinervis]|uniref:Uncharacterized protein n=1 Tax=Rhamnella rubrinervis TaxID=2594499 RepID=A0A8K0HRJ9_9ROSA|nr:hypothetical protein FNV43_RR02018 [Rhamnella rubrinervis]